jgi:hypothetical protein
MFAEASPLTKMVKGIGSELASVDTVAGTSLGVVAPDDKTNVTF